MLSSSKRIFLFDSQIIFVKHVFISDIVFISLIFAVYVWCTFILIVNEKKNMGERQWFGKYFILFKSERQ